MKSLSAKLLKTALASTGFGILANLAIDIGFDVLFPKKEEKSIEDSIKKVHHEFIEGKLKFLSE